MAHGAWKRIWHLLLLAPFVIVSSACGGGGGGGGKANASVAVDEGGIDIEVEEFYAISTVRQGGQGRKVKCRWIDG